MDAEISSTANVCGMLFNQSVIGCNEAVSGKIYTETERYIKHMLDVSCLPLMLFYCSPIFLSYCLPKCTALNRHKKHNINNQVFLFSLEFVSDVDRLSRLNPVDFCDRLKSLWDALLSVRCAVWKQ